MSEITRNQAIQIVEDIRTAISAGSVTNTMEAQVLEYCVSVLGRRIVEASQSEHIENLPDVAAFLAGISPSATLKALLEGITDAVEAINANIGNGYVYAGIATPSGTPVSGKVFYLAKQAGQYANFGGLTVTEGVNILKRNGSTWTQEQLLSMADIRKNPLIGYYECDTAGDTSAKTVTAAGYVLPATGGSVKIKMANRNTVANATLNINSTGAKPLYYNGQRAGVGNTWDTNEIIEVFYDGAKYQAYNVAGCNGDGVFDISAYNLTDGQPTPYEDLAAALGPNGDNVPLSLRKGGMSIKFVQTDNTYVQYRLMSDSFNTIVANWQGVDDEPVAGSKNLVESGKIINPTARFANTGSLPYDEFLMISGQMVNERIIDSTLPITDETNWLYTDKRLWTKTPFSFSEDKQIRCDSGYYFKVAEVDHETNIVISGTSTEWRTSYTLHANTLYVLWMCVENGDVNPITTNEHVHVYIDTFRKHVTDKEVEFSNGISENDSLIKNINSSWNFLCQYYKDVARKYVSDSSKSVFSDDAWSNISTRISLYKRVITTSNNLLIKVDAGYNMCIAKADPQTGMLLSSAIWTTNYIAEAGESFVFYLQHSDNTQPIYEADAVHIHTRMLEYEFNTRIKVNDYHNPMDALYTKFIRSALYQVKDAHEQIIGKLWYSYQTPNIRCSAVFTLDRSITISMRKPSYVFRLYWYETVDNTFVLHTTDWGSIWEVPANVEVGLVIKPISGNFPDDERPEIYLEEYKVDNETKEYFKIEIEDTVNKVNAAFTEPGLCFLLSTDQHTMSVQGTLLKYDTISDMVVNMRAVAKRIKIDAHISLGDIADYKVGTAAAFAKYGVIIDDNNPDYQYLDEVFYKWMTDAMVKLKSVHSNFLYINGNHDDNRYINTDKLHESPSQYDYTKGEMFSYYVGKGMHNVVYNNTNNGLDYYVDYENFKIRTFFLDANYYSEEQKSYYPFYAKQWAYGWSDETMTWFTQQLALVPNDYSVILFTHMSPIKENNCVSATSTDPFPYYHNSDEIKAAIQSFINGGGNYIATLYGHSHVDMSFTTPWLEVAFGCQKCINGSGKIINGGTETIVTAPTRTAGTYTEDLWSVVCILPQSRKIKIIRFGAGDDREFTY